MGSGLSFLWMMIQTVIALAVVCGVAYFLFRIVLPKFSFTGTGNSMVRVVDRISLDARKSLCIIEVADKWMLIAVSETGVQLVSELDAKAAAEAESMIAEARLSKSGSLSAGDISGKVSEFLGRKKQE